MSDQPNSSVLTHGPIQRRRLLAALAGLGLGSATFQRALAWQAEQMGRVTPEAIRQAEWIAGIELSDDDRQALTTTLERDLRKFAALRQVELRNDIPPALHFFAAPPQAENPSRDRSAVQPIEWSAGVKPSSDDELAFLPVTELSALLRGRQVSSVELTKLYLARLQRFDPLLKCVVTLTEDLALQQAQRADRELAAGHYRGPLHGIPWGAKDIIAWPGYPTTWGAGHYRTQVIDRKAAVAKRLEDAGAVLIAKLSVGSLALGDQWHGGMTRNPWNPEEGSSGSSAGSTAAVVAGLVGFAIGSETLGSIVSPCRRCSASGLRPTFGRVSRAGCMTLSWSMDKLGPIARSIEDCALILGAIHGSDPDDLAAVNRPFAWPPPRDVSRLKIGFFEGDRPAEEQRARGIVKDLGCILTPIKLPSTYPVSALTLMLDTEAAAAFDDLTRAGVHEGIGRWGNTFRAGQFVPAIEYLRASRVRTLVMREMEQTMANIDAYIGGDDLALTNLTGHPTAVVPAGTRDNSPHGQPGTITFTGRLFGETELLALAHAYQCASGVHLKRPPLDRLLADTNLAQP